MQDLSKQLQRLIPEHMQGAVERYLVHGIEPGDFLAAVISNNLAKAVSHADGINVERLSDFVRFFYNYTPQACWGSPEAYHSWIISGGLLGQRRAGQCSCS